MSSKLSLIIRWSDEDQMFIAWVPELGTGVKTHGKTYIEAAKMGQEVIEMWEAHLAKDRRPIPKPWAFHSSLEDERIGQILLPGNSNYQDAPKSKRTKQSA